METLCLTFSGTPMLFFAPATHEDSYFSTSSSALLFRCFDHSIHPGGCKVISHVALIYIFSMTNDTEHFFTCFFAFPVSSLGSSVTWLFKCYAILKMLSLYCYCKRFLYVLHIPLQDSSVLNIFFRPFHILNRCFASATVLVFMEPNLSFCFCGWCIVCFI